MTSHTARSLALAAALLAAPGCLLGWGVGGGAVIDPCGDSSGAQLSLRGYLGMGDGDSWALAEHLGAVASPGGVGEPHVGPAFGIDFFSILDDGELGLHLALDGRFDFAFPEGADPAAWSDIGGTVALVGLWEDTSGDSFSGWTDYEGVGLEVGAYARSDASGERTGLRSLVTVSLVYENWLLEDDFLEW